DHIGGGDRLDLAVLLQEIRAEERALGRLEEEARVPAVGHVRRAAVAPAVPPRHDDLAVRERPRRPVGDVVHADDGTHDAARRLGPRREREPVVQRAAFVGFEVAEADPTDTCGIDDPRHRRAHHRERLAEPGVEEERLVVTDEELVEREVGLRDEGRDAEEVRCDLGHLGHAATCLPVSVWEVAASTRTRTTSPGSAGPGKTTVFSCGLLPAIQPAVRRAGASVPAKSSSSSPGKPTMTSVESARPGTRARRRATRASYSATVYSRPMPPSTRSEPDCTGRWSCGATCGHSAMASTRRALMSEGCGEVKRMRRMPGTSAARRRSSAKSQTPSWYAFTVCPRKTTSRTPARASARTCSRSTAPG